MTNGDKCIMDEKSYLYFPFCPILKLEKRLFGWEYVGKTVNKHYGYGMGTDKRPRLHVFFVMRAHFQRPYSYIFNSWFSFIESLWKMIGFFRRVVDSLPLLLMLVVFFIMFLSLDGGIVAWILLSVFLAINFLSIGLASVGYMIRRKCNP